MENKLLRRYRIVVIALIVMNLGVIVAWWFTSERCNFNSDSDEHRKHRSEWFFDALGLDSIQRKEFKELKIAHFEKLGALNEEVDKLRDEIRAEMANQPFDKSKVDTLFLRIAEKRTTIDTLVYSHFHQLRGLCSPQQAVILDSLILKMMKKQNKFERGRPDDKEFKK